MPTNTDFTAARLTPRALRIASLVVISSVTLAACASGRTRFPEVAASPVDRVATVVATPATSAAPVSSFAPGEPVAIKGFTFVPGTTEVAVGTTVVWANDDLVAHTVTSDSPLFDSGNLQNKQTFSWTFDAAGTYTYHCTIHPNMVATITVRG